jgi:hypothetical protein
MRKFIRIFGVAAMVTGLMLSAAQAQDWKGKTKTGSERAPTRSCSDMRGDCLSEGNPASKCNAMKASCMSTGRWVGIDSGKDYGAHRKQ